jgi:pimeloyl-ACP methyl ester carboxylesterase
MRFTLATTAIIGAVLLISCGGQTPSRDAPSHDAAPPPADWEAGTAESADGVAIRYAAYGDGDTGVVLIHGWSCDRGHWDAQVGALEDDLTVVVVDLAGHGHSGAERDDWSMNAFGEDVRAVVEQLGMNRVVLVGHSMGGPVALEAAGIMPERVVGIVGVDTFHDLDAKPDEAEWQALMEAWEADFPGSCDLFVRSMFLPTSDPELVEDVIADLCDADPSVAVELMRRFPDYDQAEAARRLNVPVRSINAALWPTDVEGNREIADYDAVIVEDVGHFLMMERPDEFNAHLEEVVAGMLAY